ncbi:hypothetical protein CVT25_010274 [Psilocybe cyanescens]|uniref:Uncharacterized protein n=1 Tax=Psilocybe cyanescens TaxID=93625 RepID=A0A409X2R9_PSICY|nr:hypothetical protein CVT25_010274 [Psilocybe cyanescens]
MFSSFGVYNPLQGCLSRDQLPSNSLNALYTQRLKSIDYRYTQPAPYPDETFEEALGLVSDFRRSEGHFFYTTTPKGYFGAAIILNFEKSEPHRKIQLIMMHHSPLQMMLNFHSSQIFPHLLWSFFTDTPTLAADLMNIITHEKAYSLYPRGTFDGRRSLLYHSLKNDHQLLVATAKLATRRWQIVHKISRDEFANPRTLPILPELNLPASNMEANSWALSYDADLVPNMTATLFVSTKLCYGYLIADELLQKYVLRLCMALDAKFERAVRGSSFHMVCLLTVC